MQYFVSLEMPEEISALWPANPESCLLAILNSRKDQLIVMLQGYHTHEKVSGVEFDRAALKMNGDHTAHVKVQYVLEEFSVCSNIDRVQTEFMPLQLTVDPEVKVLNVAGIYIPEREPDSF